MKRILGVLLLAFAASASTINVGPLELSGCGTYSWYYGGGPSISFDASGENGNNSTSLSVNEGADSDEFAFPGLPPSLSLEEGWEMTGTAVIDGIVAGCFECSGSTFFDWTGLGDGRAEIDIFDRSDNLLATSALIGYVTYTNIIYIYDGNALVEVNAAIDISPISPTPEPRPWVLCGLPFLLLSAQLIRRRCQSRMTVPSRQVKMLASSRQSVSLASVGKSVGEGFDQASVPAPTGSGRSVPLLR
jgi:hypothetical protein